MTVRRAGPWDRTAVDEFAAGSIKALFRGDATEHQQKKVAEFILTEICGIGDLQYYPDSVRDSDFAQGKRFVGMELVRVKNMAMPKAKPEPAKRTRRGTAV